MTSTIAKIEDENDPPMVLVVLVSADAIPVWPRGAAAAAAAGMAPTSAPEPSPAMNILVNTCQVSRWKGRNNRYPPETKNAAMIRATRGEVFFESQGKMSAPTIIEIRYTPMRMERWEVLSPRPYPFASGSVPA